MALKVVNTESLDAVADAINAKAGTSGKLQFPEGFVEAVEGISAGGGGGSLTSPKEVNFYDYDGTLLHAYTVEEAQALTELPELPTQKGLICQGWNWSLEDIKAHNRAVDVGAIYITDDGKTRLYIRVDEAGLSVPIRFSQTISNGVIVDWGDASGTEQEKSAGSVFLSHVYESTGEFVISLAVVENCELSFYSTSNVGAIFGGKSKTHMLKKVEIGANVTYFDYAFTGCYSLETITLPNNISHIAKYAFNACYSLKSIIIPSIKSGINSYAFNSCYSLKTVSIPNDFNGASTPFGDYAFSGCNSLKSITIPNNAVCTSGATTFGTRVFSGCVSLESISLPEGITETGFGELFNNCTSLKTINAYSTSIGIKSKTFYDCRSLEFINVQRISYISDYAFHGCSMMKSIDMQHCESTSIKQYAFYGCFSLETVTLPNTITLIDANAFYNCYSLVSLKIPSSVTEIKGYAFGYCRSMVYYDFTSHTAVPTLSSTNAFYNIPSDCEIRVPASLVDEWKSATNWATYADKIVGV